MGLLFEIFAAFIGRWILESIGRGIRKTYHLVLGLFGGKHIVKKDSTFDGLIDMEEYSNRIIGLITIFIAIAIGCVFF